MLGEGEYSELREDRTRMVRALEQVSRVIYIFRALA